MAAADKGDLWNHQVVVSGRWVLQKYFQSAKGCGGRSGGVNQEEVVAVGKALTLQVLARRCHCFPRLCENRQRLVISSSPWLDVRNSLTSYYVETLAERWDETMNRRAINSVESAQIVGASGITA